MARQKKIQRSSGKTRKKKVGSSNSKFKTPRISKNSSPIEPVGHKLGHELTPQDDVLFRAFQSNLLSLISHELRTPLTGVLNSLTLLEESDAESLPEYLSMAKRNANRLKQSLSMLLDLAALDAEVFKGRLREVDLQKMIQSVSLEYRPSLEEKSVDLYLKTPERTDVTVLGDSRYLMRAIDLVFQCIIPRVKTESSVSVSISKMGANFEFVLDPQMTEVFETAHEHLKIGAMTKLKAFSKVIGKEEEFLSRKEEGLGSEFLILDEILKMHNGLFEVELESNGVARLELKLPVLESEEALKAVLSSRAFSVSSELGALALIVVQVPSKKSADEFCLELKRHLFRATDAAYALPDQHEVALVLDDCKTEDIPRLLDRLSGVLGSQPVGMAHCPSESLDPLELLELARNRLK